MSKKGFTLIELLMATTLFLLASLTFGYVLKMEKGAGATALRLNQAIYTLQAEMEATKALSFEALAAFNGETFAQEQGKVLVTPVQTDLAKIRLELAWDPKKDPLPLETLRSKY